MYSEKKILKYALIYVLIFCVLKYLPNNGMCNLDICATSIVLFLFYLLAENLMNNTDNFENCSSSCKIEGMADVAANNKISDLETKYKELVAKRVGEEATYKYEPAVNNNVVNNNVVDNNKEIKEEVKEVKEQVVTEEPTEKPLDMDSLQEVLSDIKNNIKSLNEKINKSDLTREGNGVLTNEMDYTDFNHLPLAENYDNDSFEYGYSFLPPEKWYPQPPFPPVCVTDKKCSVQPLYTTGTPVDVKEWNESRRVMPPDNIKTKYIKEKLNSGR